MSSENITLITVEGFSLFSEGHPQTQLKKLQVIHFVPQRSRILKDPER